MVPYNFLAPDFRVEDNEPLYGRLSDIDDPSQTSDNNNLHPPDVSLSKIFVVSARHCPVINTALRIRVGDEYQKEY